MNREMMFLLCCALLVHFAQGQSPSIETTSGNLQLFAGCNNDILFYHQSDACSASLSATSLTDVLSNMAAAQSTGTALSTQLSNTASSQASMLAAAVNSVLVLVNGEGSRASTAEAALSAGLSQTASQASSALASLAAQTNAGVVSLAGQISAASSSLAAGVGSAAAQAVSAAQLASSEQSRATAAETSLGTRVGDEVSRAQAAEGSLAAQLSGEVSRALSAEGLLSTAISSAVVSVAGDSASGLSQAASARAGLSSAVSVVQEQTSGALASQASQMQQSLVALAANIALCQRMGMTYNATGQVCATAYQDGSSLSNSAGSCQEAMAARSGLLADDAAASAPSGIYYIRGMPTFCDMTADPPVAVGRAGAGAATMFLSCSDVPAFYVANNISTFPSSGVYLFTSYDMATTYSSYCEFPAMYNGGCGSGSFPGGTYTCPPDNGPCTQTCTDTADPNKWNGQVINTLACVNGSLTGQTSCGDYLFDEFQNLDRWNVRGNNGISGSGTGAFGWLNSLDASFESKAIYDTSEGLTIEIKWRQGGTGTNGRQCMVAKFGGTAGTRHSGINWGVFWWGDHFGFGNQDTLTELGTTDIPRGVYMYMRTTISSDGHVNIYNNGVWLASWSQPSTTQGRVVIGDSCVDMNIDWIKIVKGVHGGSQSIPENYVSEQPWMLAAKITSDFEWVCPDRFGQPCVCTGCPSSRVTPQTTTDLFSPVHARTALDLSTGVGPETGIHLPLNVLQLIAQNGAGRMRITFYDEGWEPIYDGEFVMGGSMKNSIFQPGVNNAYTRGVDYSFSLITDAGPGTYSGNLVCWLTSFNQRGAYESGLFMGQAYSTTAPCHMANDVAYVQLKSHLGAPGNVFYSGQIPFLTSRQYSASSNRIAIWVR
eukprot:m.212688 g.212688  ORF g.212688 m.212688 type:complete len:883 (+) comp22153_c0_seq7:273-2921(+)